MRKVEKIQAVFFSEEQSINKLDKFYYGQMGIQIYFAQDYQQSLEHLKNNNIQVLIINSIDHPLSPNVQRLIKYLSQPGNQNIPVVLTGVKITEELKQLAIAEGISLVIEQPIAKDIFIHKIKSLLAIPKREHIRMIPIRDARYIFRVNHIIYEGLIYNLSFSGMKIRLDKIIDIRKNIKVRLLLPGVSKPIEIMSKIIRIAPSKESNKRKFFSIAVEFIEFTGYSKELLKQFLLLEEQSDIKKSYYD